METTTKGGNMTTKTLTEPVLIGRSRYETGTEVKCSEVIEPGTWDERIWVDFPNGEGTYMKPRRVK
jgi:hypothetical protein